MKNRHDNIDVSNIIKGVTGATMSAGTDCYPYTIHDYKVSKTGRVTIFVTSDDVEWIPLNPGGNLGSVFGVYKYTTIPPTNGGAAIKLWTKEGQMWNIGQRKYYQDPSF